MRRITNTPTSQTRSGASTKAGTTLGRLPDRCSRFELPFPLPLDLVELVLTCFPNLFKTRKEAIVDRHDQSLLWPHYCILYIIVLHQLLSVRSASIDPLDLILSLGELESVGPDMSGIAHQRTTPSQKHRCIVHRRLDDERTRRRLFFDDLCKPHTGGIKDPIFD